MTPGQSEERRLWYRDAWIFVGVILVPLMLVIGSVVPILGTLTLSSVVGAMTMRILWPRAGAPQSTRRRRFAIVAGLTVLDLLLVFGKDLLLYGLILMLGPS